jgi:hypothetical protein
MLKRLASSLALGARRVHPDRLRVLLQSEAAPQLEGNAAGHLQALVSCCQPFILRAGCAAAADIAVAATADVAAATAATAAIAL